MHYSWQRSPVRRRGHPARGWGISWAAARYMGEPKMVMKRRKQKGFTLIELIIVIVIIAILAAVAIPKYLDLQNEAKKAATQGIAGALGSASAANYAIRSGIPSKGAAVANCTDVGTLLQDGSMTGFTITAAAIAAGTTATCTVDHATPGSATSATFTGHGIS